MYAAEHAHFPAAYAIRHLLQPTILSYYSLVFFRHRAPTASSANTPLSPIRARSSSTRFTGPSSVSGAPTTSSANTATLPSRDRSAAAHPSTTTSRGLSIFSSDPTPSGSRINLRRVYCTSSRSTTHGSACLQRHATVCSQGIIALSRTCLFVLLFLEFLLEYLLGICFGRIDFLFFSFGFDFAVQLVSRCLFFALTFGVVPLLTSTCVCVLVSVCYPGFPATGLARSIFVIRPKNCVCSVFLFLPV